jgi:hypothetical protein
MTTNFKKVASFVCVGGLILLAGIIGIGISDAYLNQKRAERVLMAFRTVRVGSTDRARALQIAGLSPTHRYEGKVYEFPEWVFHYDNGLLFRMHLSPYTSFDATLVFKDEVVQEKEVRVFIASGFAALVNERTRGFRLPNGITTSKDLPHNVVFSRNSLTNVRTLSVYDDDSYGEKELAIDWVVDLGCMSKLCGCKDAREILPNIRLQLDE